ncbi:MAG: ATP-binding protein [Pseudomonadota bacterium]
MTLGEIWRLVAPAAVVVAAGGAAQLYWQEPMISVIVAGVAALGYELIRPAREQRSTGPSQTTVRSTSGREPRDPSRPWLPAGTGRELLERLPLGVMLIDQDSQVQFVNSAGIELFGRLPPRVFRAAQLRAPKLLAAVEECGIEGRPGVADFTLMRGADRHLRAHLQPLPQAEPDIARGSVLLVIEDLTRSMQVDEVYRDFVANASHELKTPLASISGLIETLQGHAKDDPKARDRFLGVMATQADRMRRLVEDMLSLNRIEQNERVLPRTPECLRDIVGETVNAMMPIARNAKISLGASLPAVEHQVHGSREELAQVFQNLIDNAIKYGRAGDSVQVEPVPPAPERPGMIGIAVVDTGPGIERTHLPRLTQRFYRVSPARSREQGGTGLGLAIVKHIVNRHRGHLQIESEVGEGSRFTVWLPLLGAPSTREIEMRQIAH